MHLTLHEMKDFLLSTSTKCSILLSRGGRVLAIPSPPPFLTALQYVINKDNNKHASQSRRDVNGTGTVWIAWHCQSSQQLPDINSSSLWRSCALSSPVQHCSQALSHWGCLPRVRLGWEPEQGLCLQPAAPACTRGLLLIQSPERCFWRSPQETSPCMTTNIPLVLAWPSGKALP